MLLHAISSLLLAHLQSVCMISGENPQSVSQVLWIAQNAPMLCFVTADCLRNAYVSSTRHLKLSTSGKSEFAIRWSSS